MRRSVIPIASAVVVAIVLVACDTSTPRRDPTPPAGSAPATAPAPAATTRAEPNVISGRVTTASGDPLAGAQIRIVGYTGGATLGQEIETVATDGDGRYRYAVARGLYEVLGQAALDFDGQTYTFDLDPVDRRCDQRMSDDGIVQDLVLNLAGPRACVIDDPGDNYALFHGAAIQLFDRLERDPVPDAVVEYILEPIGPLADGSAGRSLAMERTIEALHTSAGPIEDTWILHDIPLGIYRVSASLQEPDGAVTPLLVTSPLQGTPSPSAEVRFGARTFLGGYTVPDVTIWDPAG